MPKEYSEDALVEQPAIEVFEGLGWRVVNAWSEKFGPSGTLGREHTGEVILRSELRAALERLNREAPREAVDAAVEEVMRDRSSLGAAAANRQLHELLRDGVPVTFAASDEDGNDSTQSATLHLIDWANTPGANSFLLVSQLWVNGEIYTRRTDLVGFVNGLPLVFVELKASHKSVQDAFNDNLRDYKDTIPHLFTPSAFLVLSNGSETRVGTLTAGWEHFVEWKKINSEGEQGVISLETVIRGMCEPTRLLDIVENFLVFSQAGGVTAKILAKNHQYLGVNAAIDALKSLKEQRKQDAEAAGRLGVFWHTQGSGKSLSMVFFSQKVARKVEGNWTFVVVTDREDLDKQIYKTFADVDVLQEAESQVRARSGDHLQQLLSEDHRYVFTLIQKFRTDKGARYPKLSDRGDVVVMTDEAHRSQYDLFALNMRNALPRASFIGFTGTPLMGDEEKTREVFGPYVSTYNFAQAIADNATVPLYYENRIPELQLDNEGLNKDIAEVLDAAGLEAEEEKTLEREFAREYHLLTREERLDEVARDLVAHFTGRVPLAKAMAVCLDKATAVKMFNRVQEHWKARLSELRQQLADLGPAAEGEEGEALAQRLWLQKQAQWMDETDMAVVVSSAQNEVADFRAKGLDIVPHRKRIAQEDLEGKFKDAKDPLRLVFVCAMWMTGFDVPSCATIYLDKPMRNHTLMQTIARANRVFGEKTNGLIVDYIGVFRDLQKALAIYGAPSKGEGGEAGALVDSPARPKSELVEALRGALAEMEAFCAPLGIDASKAEGAQGFDRIKLLDDAREAILGSQERKKKYLALANTVNRLFQAILPDVLANEFSASRAFYVVLADKIRSLDPNASGRDLSGVAADMEALLDLSIGAGPYVIQGAGAQGLIDLAKIDFDKVLAQTPATRRKTEAEKLAGAINAKVKRMVRLNKSRIDYQEKYQAMIQAYNEDSSNVEEHLRRLAEFTRELNQEDERALREKLSEAELAIFDILTRPEPALAPEEEKEVKAVARELLDVLEREKLGLDWRKRQQSRAAVRVSIEDALDRLPDSYSKELYEQKCDLVFGHIYESYFGAGRSLYTQGTRQVAAG